jgi:hypothetical protein
MKQLNKMVIALWKISLDYIKLNLKELAMLIKIHLDFLMCMIQI